MPSLQEIISAIHHPRYGGLPTHYPALAAWGPAGAFSPALALRRARGPKRPVGVYAHIPYCATRCRFCFLDVAAARPGAPALDAYAAALLAEAGRLAPAAPAPADNIYIGGGTPNLMGASALAGLVERLRKTFRLRRGGQVSMEANPDFFDEEKLRALRAAGLNLILAGVQSFDPALMKRMNRSQHSERLKRAFGQMRDAGFDNINADLLCGLPGQDRAGFLRDVRLLAAIRPEHIHINRYKSGGTGPAEKAGAEALRREGMELLAAEGYALCDEDSASLAPERMNAQGDPDFQLDAHIIGLGAGAMSHAWGAARWQNIKEPAAYAAAAAAGKPAAFRAARLTVAEELEHWLINRLLRPLPVTRRQAAARFGAALLPAFNSKMAALAAAGAVEETERGVYAARPGRWFEITAGLYGRRYLAAVAAGLGAGRAR